MYRRHLSTVLLAAFATACGGEGITPPPSTGGGTPPPEVTRPRLPTNYAPSGLGASGATFVHLFEWTWPDIAAECENVLGPAGVHAVQVSPPSEHAVVGGDPWWQRYQPVSYDLESRSGTAAEFADMVNRCSAAGVEIYVDAVINHMTAGSGTGSNGTVYTKYSYPGPPYGQADFHPPCEIRSYQDAAQVQECELVGLADLNTGSAAVRGKIAAYLIALHELGVAGYRIDAAKHMQPVELDSILQLVNADATGRGEEPPYVFAEVIDNGGEAVTAADYYGLGFSSGGSADITDFRFRWNRDPFSASAPLSNLQGATTGSPGSMPSDKAVVFVENHDTQRDGGMTLETGLPYRMAHIWMLAQPYGYPKIMSSYRFTSRDQSPPALGGGETRAVDCAAAPVLEVSPNGWVCEHRDPALLGMVGFRRATSGAGVTNWWDNDGEAIAFERGDRGFIAINMEASSYPLDVVTQLAPGSYCDVISGRLDGGVCTGAVVVVDADGRIVYSVDAGEAVAIHADGRVP